MKIGRFVVLVWLVALVVGQRGLAAGAVRVACVGDSITYGARIDHRTVNSYPALLGKLLGAGFQTRNFGVSGATLLRKGDRSYWTLREFKMVGEYEPAIIVLMLGMNDSKPQNWAHKLEFAADYAAMVEHFEALPSKPRVWACLPIPVYKTAWGINETVVRDEIIPLIKRVAVAKHVPVLDLHAALSGHGDLFPDGVHPDAAGAALIAKTVAAALTAPGR